jgi:hypothetical protein
MKNVERGILYIFIGLLSVSFAREVAAQATLENPQPGSFQSGIGLISGWSCSSGVIIVIDGQSILPAYGTSRLDAAPVCGGNANVGFGLLLNYNLLGSGTHTAELEVNGAAVGSPAAFTVTVPVGEFATGLAKTVTVADFPSAGQTTTLVWQQSQQNFAIAGVSSLLPAVTLDTPAAGATQLSGRAYNVDPTKIKVVIYALTNQWYVQPLVATPFTNISADGTWVSATNPWSSIVVLLVDPANYAPAATEITNPALDPGVLAWTEYPSGPVSVDFSGRTWGIKATGTAPSDVFDPGPNFWSNSSSVVNVAADGLHLKITQINGMWQCGEVYLLQSLGYGTYTVQVSSHVDQLDPNTVAAPLFIYAAPGQELDNEYGGAGGLIPSPYSAQFVVQPYTVAGNIVRYVQPSTSQFTTQMEWRADHVTFRAWNGWSTAPAPGDIIYQWTYTGGYIPPPGQERVHINLWLLNGDAPVSGNGDEMVVSSFTFQP